jgi:hypothetical protein
MADATPATSPTFLGMVMCDNILQDPETRQYHLLGTATVTYARAFPARSPRMCIYLVLTGIREPCTVEVKLVRVDSDAKEDRDIMSVSGTVDASDPLAVAEVTMRLRNLVFPKPGEYRFQLWTGGTFLGERRFVVKQMK